ncbi:MAG: hypothetical protein ACOZBZ_00670 [Patescibacteria group bacterium]
MKLFDYQFSLTARQTEELAKFSLDISKLSLGSWVLGLFTARIGLPQLFLAFGGLTISVLFFTLGMRLFREVK